MQNKKKLVNKSQDNEFGDKSNLDTCQKWAQFEPQKFFWRLKPPVTARSHCFLSKYAKQKKSLSIQVKILSLETKK